MNVHEWLIFAWGVAIGTLGGCLAVIPSHRRLWRDYRRLNAKIEELMDETGFPRGP